MRLFKNLLRHFPWYSALVIGAATGCAMAGLGLGIRIGGSAPGSVLEKWFGVELFAAAGLTAGRIGWMLVLTGVFLMAAMCAFAVRNHWGWWSTAAAGMISLIFFPGGSLAGIIVLAALGVKLIREKPWLRRKAAAQSAALP
jgi:hypothetical protein